MKLSWYDRDELLEKVENDLLQADIVLDIGCGIRPQQYVIPKVHICCEPYAEYMAHLQNSLANKQDRQYVFLRATWDKALEILPPKSVDTVFILDVIEHLEKDSGRSFLKKTEEIARRQIVVFTPLGFFPQHHPDGKDAWGFDGGDWQEHKSGWTPEDFDDSWEIFATKEFFLVDNLQKKLKTPFGAMFAVRTFFDSASNIEKQKSIKIKVTKRRRIHNLVDLFFDKIEKKV